MILHVIDNLRPESGGPTTVAVELARQQALAGRRVSVLCRQGPNSNEARRRLEDRWSGLGIEYMELGDANGGGARLSVEGVLERVRPEAMHVHCIWEGLVRRACDAAHRRRIPYFISTHGMLHPVALASKRWKKRMYLAAFPRYLPRAAELFALNREEADFVLGRFNPRCSVLPNGIDVAEYCRVEDGSFRRTVPALGDRPFILFVGRLHRFKGIDLLLRSFAHARREGCPAHIVLIGPDDGAKPEVERTIDELGLRGCAHLPGGLFGSEKIDAFAACSVFAHRPRFEGFGITVVEALAAGKPVVTTAACRLDGAVEAGALVQVADTDEAFGEALAAIFRDTAKSLQLGARGREWVRASFGWKALVAQLDACYAEPWRR